MKRFFKRFASVLLLAGLVYSGPAYSQYRALWYTNGDTLYPVSPNYSIAANGFVSIPTNLNNLFLGLQSGNNVTTGTFNLGLGYQSLYYCGQAYGNIGVGYQALKGLRLAPSTSTYNIGIGAFALSMASNTTEEIGIGYNALANDTSSSLNVMIGTNAGGGIFNVFSVQNVGIGNNVLTAGNGGMVGSDNVVIGNRAGANTTGSANIILGSNAEVYNQYGDSSVIIGYGAAFIPRGADVNGPTNSVVIGNQAGYYSEGTSNVMIGSYAGYNASGIGGTNVPFRCVFLGSHAGYSDTTGYNDIYLGPYSGFMNGSGLRNLFIGDSAGYNELGSNKLYIANSATSNPLFGGDFSVDSAVVHGRLIISNQGANAKHKLPLNILNSAGTSVASVDSTGHISVVTSTSIASAGTGTLVGGTLTVSTTAVTANSLIFLTSEGGTITNLGTIYVSAKTAGVSFTVTSTNALDTSNFVWWIIN